MLEEMLNLDNIPHFKLAGLDGRIDEVLQFIDDGISPVVIHDEKAHRFLLFGWEDFFHRFGWLYTAEEKNAIEVACAEYEKNVNGIVRN